MWRSSIRENRRKRFPLASSLLAGETPALLYPASNLPFFIRNPQSAIRNPQSPIPNPQSLLTASSLQSPVYSLQSTAYSLQPTA